MWPFCTANSFLWLLLPLLIGLLAGWWAWHARGAIAASAYAPPDLPGVTAPRVRAPDPELPRVSVPDVDPPRVAVPDVPTPTPGLGLAGLGAGAAALTAIGIPAAIGPADDLRRIKGVGPKLGALLTSIGVTRFDQVAAWGSAEIAKVDEHLGAFKGRIQRDSWIEQAGLLARGMIAEFEAKFGKIDDPKNT